MYTHRVCNAEFSVHGPKCPVGEAKTKAKHTQSKVGCPGPVLRCRGPRNHDSDTRDIARGQHWSITCTYRVCKAEFPVLGPKCPVGEAKPRQNTRNPQLASRMRLTSGSSVGQMMELFTCSAQLSRFAPRVFGVLALLDITDVRPLLDASANNDNWKSLTDAMFFVEGKNVVGVYAQSSLKAPAFHARSAEMAPKSVEATHSSAVAFPPAVVDSARLSSGPTASAVPTADFPRPAPRRSLEFGQHLSLTTSETPIPTAPLLLASPVVPSALPSTSPQRAAACWAKRPPQVWLGQEFLVGGQREYRSHEKLSKQLLFPEAPLDTRMYFF